MQSTVSQTSQTQSIQTSNAEKFQNLSLALEAQPAEILVDIDESCDSAYQDAWDALAKRFGSVDDKREAMHRFNSRKQNTDESVAEFVAALKLAYHEAWPKACLLYTSPSPRD